MRKQFFKICFYVQYPARAVKRVYLLTTSELKCRVFWQIRATYFIPCNHTYSFYRVFTSRHELHVTLLFFTFYWSAAKDLDKDCSRPSTQVGVGVHMGVVGVALWMWENTTRGLMSAKIMQIQGNISDFSGIMCLQHICFYLRVSFSDSSFPPCPPSPFQSASSVIIRIQFLCAIFHLITDLIAPHVSCRQNRREMK